MSCFTDESLAAHVKLRMCRVPPAHWLPVRPAIVTCQYITCLPPGRWLVICPDNIHGTENSNSILNQNKSNASNLHLIPLPHTASLSASSHLPHSSPQNTHRSVLGEYPEVGVLQVDSSWKGHGFLSLPLFASLELRLPSLSPNPLPPSPLWPNPALTLGNYFSVPW